MALLVQSAEFERPTVRRLRHMASLCAAATAASRSSAPGDAGQVPKSRFAERSFEGRSFLERDEVTRILAESAMDDDDLLQALVPVAARLARPKISSYHVGAVGLGRSGRIYLGCNVEFPGATLASSIHAEQCLLANLVAAGESGLAAVAISAPPCGHCRQFLSEMCCADSVRLIFGQRPDNTYSLADILPHRFGPHDLLADQNQPLLLEEQSHGLVLTSGARAILDRRKTHETVNMAAGAALAAAERSYSPYLRLPAGVALVTERGIHAGGLIENAAFNPTLQPLQAAFAAAVLAGLEDYDEVSLAVLVELEGQAVSQEASVRLLLEAVAPQCELLVLHAECKR